MMSTHMISLRDFIILHILGFEVVRGMKLESHVSIFSAHCRPFVPEHIRLGIATEKVSSECKSFIKLVADELLPELGLQTNIFDNNPSVKDLVKALMYQLGQSVELSDSEMNPLHVARAIDVGDSLSRGDLHG